MKCLKIGSGELVFPIASDDFLSNELFFEKAISILKENPEISGFFAKTEIRSANLKKKLWDMGHADIQGRITNHEAIELFFSNRLFVPGSSALWRKKNFNEVGGFDFRLGAQCDYFINHILPMRNGVYFWNEIVTVMRKSEKSYSAKINDKKFFLNHALFEKKTKSFLVNPRPSEQQWNQWRKSLINARLNIELNAYLFERIQQAFNRIHEWEKDALAPYIKEIMRIFQTESNSFNKLIKIQEEKAHAIFNGIAGQIEGASSQAASLCRVSLAAKVFKEMRSYLKKRCDDFLH